MAWHHLDNNIASLNLGCLKKNSTLSLNKKSAMNKIIFFLTCFISTAVINGQKVYTFSNPDLVPVKFERISKTVLEVPEEAPNPKAAMVEHDNESIHKGNPKPNPNALPTGPDPALQQEYDLGAKSLNSTTSNIISSWAGLSASVTPSDNNIAVGPNHIVQMTNNSTSSYLRIWNKAGTLLVANKTVKSFSGITDYGDPNILYDQAADRFVFVLLYSKNAKKLEVCVSTTNDPTGSFYIYTFTTANGFPDYPKIGVWGNSYFITTNSNAPTIFALNRALMLAGTGTGTAQVFSLSKFPNIGFQSASPVSQTGATLPPAGAPASIIRVADDAWSSTLGPDHLEIFNLHIDWTTPANSTITGPVDINTISYNSNLCGFGSGSCIPQPGSTVKLDPLSDIVMDKVQYRNFGDHEALVCSHVCNADGLGTAGIRWYELRKAANGNWFIYQQSTYFPSSDDRFMSSITINDKGTIALGYNISSTSLYPGIRITGRDSCDALSNMTVSETVVKTGTAANSSNRYGDYNGMVTDPADGSFWFTGQYNATSAWSTNVVHFNFSNCPVIAGPRSISGIDETGNLLNSSLSIVPNPATEEVKISFDAENSENSLLQVIDMTGKLVLEQNKQVAPDNNTTTVNVGSLANGYYLVKVMQGKNSATRKLVIER